MPTSQLRAAIARYDVPYLQSKILAIWGPGVTKTRQNPDLAVANIVTAINIVKQNRCKFECVGQYLLEWIKCFESEWVYLIEQYSSVSF